MSTNKKILVGMSGGVDSAVVAAILAKQGNEVIAYTLKLLESFSVDEDGEEDNSKGCCSFEDIKDATRVCDKIGGINHVVQNWKSQFYQTVIKPYIDGARDGVTTNPCITCNSSIKIPVLMAVAAKLGCSKVATGHYARVSSDGKHIMRAANLKKDQSYFLWDLTPDIISRLMFPLGEVSDKEDTREMAREFNLHISEKKDSTNLCFLKGGTKEEFLSKNGVVSEPGNFVDTNGTVLGKHQGYTKYVPGQRTGLNSANGARFVLNVVADTNTVVVGDKSSDGLSTVTINNAKWVDGTKPSLDALEGVCRYHSAPVGIKSISENSDDNTWTVEFNTPVFGITKGQHLVFYQNDCVMGGGVFC